MMRDDASNLHVDPVRMEMTGTQQIPISCVCESDQIKPKDILAKKNISQVCSTDEGESESVIFNESSTEDNESESVHKSINTTNIYIYNK